MVSLYSNKTLRHGPLGLGPRLFYILSHRTKLLIPPLVRKDGAILMNIKRKPVALHPSPWTTATSHQNRVHWLLSDKTGWVKFKPDHHTIQNTCVPSHWVYSKPHSFYTRFLAPQEPLPASPCLLISPCVGIFFWRLLLGVDQMSLFLFFARRRNTKSFIVTNIDLSVFFI